MKTELKLVDHDILPGHKVVELWHEGKVIGKIYGSDGPGIRLITDFAVDEDVLDLMDASIVVVVIKTH